MDLSHIKVVMSFINNIENKTRTLWQTITKVSISIILDINTKVGNNVVDPDIVTSHTNRCGVFSNFI